MKNIKHYQDFKNSLLYQGVEHELQESCLEIPHHNCQNFLRAEGLSLNPISAIEIFKSLQSCATKIELFLSVVNELKLASYKPLLKNIEAILLEFTRRQKEIAQLVTNLKPYVTIEITKLEAIQIKMYEESPVYGTAFKKLVSGN